MSIQEAVDFLEVSRTTVYRLIKEGTIKPIYPRNLALRHPRPRLPAEQVYALRPDKAPQPAPPA